MNEELVTNIYEEIPEIAEVRENKGKTQVKFIFNLAEEPTAYWAEIPSQEVWDKITHMLIKRKDDTEETYSARYLGLIHSLGFKLAEKEGDYRFDPLENEFICVAIGMCVAKACAYMFDGIKGKTINEVMNVYRRIGGIDQ